MVVVLLLCLPLYRGGGHIALLLTAHLLVTSVFCLCSLTVYHAGGQTRDVDPMSGWANISLVLGYRVVFDATLHVGQSHKRRANMNPALVQSIVTVPPICRYLLYVCGLWLSRQARNVRPVLVECWPTVCGAGSALYRRWVDVYLVLLWWR